MQNLKAYGLGGLTLLGGFIAGHVVNAAANKNDSWIFPAVGVVGGFAGAILIGNPWLKLLCLGTMIWGAIKSINKIAGVATQPGTQGLAGFLSESLKEKIRKFIPTLGSLGDVPLTVAGTDELGNINLDDDIDPTINGNQEAFTPYEDVSVKGLGNMMALA